MESYQKYLQLNQFVLWDPSLRQNIPYEPCTDFFSVIGEEQYSEEDKIILVHHRMFHGSREMTLSLKKLTKGLVLFDFTHFSYFWASVFFFSK